MSTKRYVIEVSDKSPPLLVAELEDGTTQNIRDDVLLKIVDMLEPLIDKGLEAVERDREIEASNFEAMKQQDADRFEREVAERKESLRMAAEEEENQRLADIAEGLRRDELIKQEAEEAKERRDAEAKAIEAYNLALDSAKEDIKS